MDVSGRSTLSRRDLLQTASAAAAFTIVPASVLGGPGKTPPSQRTTIAGIGVGGQGLQNMAAFQQIPTAQVVAVCDVVREAGGYISWNWNQGKERQAAGREPSRKYIDAAYAKDKPGGTYRGCKAYCDYRELLEKEDADAVMVATPDHNHAVITLAALKRKKHVYCEKPLTYTVEEARKVAEAAREAGVATQLGNHGQASEEARVTCELIWDGAIGPVREVHVWSPARFWAPAMFDGRPPAAPVPDGVDWDLWLGVAPERPYSPEYLPWMWRNWWDFGTGLLGDLGCHKLSTVFKALKLGSPVSVEASSTRDNGETYPMGVIARFEFPARGDLPPVSLQWYDGGLRPPRPAELEPGRYQGDTLYVGEKGKMMGHRLIPESAMKAARRPPKSLPRSPGHYEEFVIACRGGVPAGANFPDHAGLLTETCQLGNIGVRCPGQVLKWDGAAFKFTNSDRANKLLSREYRKGWEL
ncbi:MAG: 1,5-anhydro-D-fructose reductase [Planctomycetes bacterium ADurb.Bin126]|nr:MAG: 1,5-anhydro-D-fructose reductase [Planctomycetes bacterium ADurb.Bin126]HQL74465.1 Gfo/Idh/MocA family oxidoreductase [Phycisphaerae bacterium]